MMTFVVDDVLRDGREVGRVVFAGDLVGVMERVPVVVVEGRRVVPFFADGERVEGVFVKVLEGRRVVPFFAEGERVGVMEGIFEGRSVLVLFADGVRVGVIEGVPVKVLEGRSVDFFADGERVGGAVKRAILEGLAEGRRLAFPLVGTRVVNRDEGLEVPFAAEGERDCRAVGFIVGGLKALRVALRLEEVEHSPDEGVGC
jgi:hypothetical protein